MRYRCAMMLLASADGNRVPVIAKLVQADQDTTATCDALSPATELGEPSLLGALLLL